MGIRSELDSNFDFEVVDEFCDHYAMMVESMEVMILDLSKEEMYQRSVNELFRVFHNIKSASGFLRIEPMRRLSTFVEEVLDELRQKNKPVSENTINWLLEISDIFAAWQDDLKNDNDLTGVKYSLLKIPDLDEN
jgi:two-component system chemotaxis sensor kinase CheA